MTAQAIMPQRAYPTGNKVIDQLVEFVADRLPAIHSPNLGRSPSLAEQWWLETVAGRSCPTKRGWSFVYRFARDQAVKQGAFSCGAADLLTHQLTELLPAVFFKALENLGDQGVRT